MSKYYNEYQYKKELYTDFNSQLSAGINQGLSLYDPQKDKTLFKDVKKLDDEYLPLIKKEKEDQDKKKDFGNFSKNLPFSPFIGGDIGSDLVNFYHYVKGDDKEYQSKTIEFYKKPVEKVLNEYSNKIYIGLAIVFLMFIIYKKI